MKGGTYMALFEVKWTGEYPALCGGEWIVKKDGVDASAYIPNRKRTEPMRAYGTFYQCLFDEDPSGCWTQVSDGLQFDEWVKENPWIEKICSDEKEKLDLYLAIQREDWRYGSCGGCY